MLKGRVACGRQVVGSITTCCGWEPWATCVGSNTGSDGIGIHTCARLHLKHFAAWPECSGGVIKGGVILCGVVAAIVCACYTACFVLLLFMVCGRSRTELAGNAMCIQDIQCYSLHGGWATR